MGKLIVIEGIDGSGKTVQTKLLVERLLKQGHQVQMTDFPQYGKSFFANMIESYLSGKFGWPQELRNHLKKHPFTGGKSETQDKNITGFSSDIMYTEDVLSKPDEVNPYLSSLLYAGDRWEKKDQMNKWLDEGDIIISNRYVCSNMAHQGAKIDDVKEREKFFNWIEELEYKVYAIPRPDLIIYLHVPARISRELIKAKVQNEKGFKSKVDIHEIDFNYMEKVQNIYLDIAKVNDSWVAIDCTKDNRLVPREEIAEKIWKIFSFQII